MKCTTTLPVTSTSRAVRARTPRMGRIESKHRDREYIRGRIAVALELALGNSHTQARELLAGLQPEIDFADNEITSLYFHARALAYYKARLIRDSFAAFERALKAARRHGNRDSVGSYWKTTAVLSRKTAASITRSRCSSKGSRSAATFGPAAQSRKFCRSAFHRRPRATRRRRASRISHATCGESEVRILVARRGDRNPGRNDAPQIASSCGVSSDPALLELAFVRPGQHQVLGQTAEAFCCFYEYSDRRTEHDALLDRAVDTLLSLDSSLSFAIRVARLGSADQVLRAKALMDQHCLGESAPLRAYRALFNSFVATPINWPSAPEGSRSNLPAIGGTGRPFLEAVALEAAGMHGAARSLRQRFGDWPTGCD